MSKNFTLFKIEKVQKKISSKNINSIINLIKFENKDSILANLSYNLIRDYINKAAFSKNFFLYLLKKKHVVIGYALLVKNQKYLSSIFKTKKIDIIIYLLKRFRFLTLLNLFLVISKLDLLLLKKKRNKNSLISLNLNLLALDKKFQSKGLGKFFLRKVLKMISIDYKFEVLSCEAPNHKVLNFYLKKIKLKQVGKKIRLFENLIVLEKFYKHSSNNFKKN